VHFVYHSRAFCFVFRSLLFQLKEGTCVPPFSQNPLQNYEDYFDYEPFCKKTFSFYVYFAEIQPCGKPEKSAFLLRQCCFSGAPPPFVGKIAPTRRPGHTPAIPMTSDTSAFVSQVTCHRSLTL
jgi:hypothetical protein